MTRKLRPSCIRKSSCDETGAAVVRDDGIVLSDVVQSQVDVHTPFGGVVPELASRDHLRNLGPVVRDALAVARITLHEIDAVAVTHRPGLVGALLVGVQAAKGIAWAAGKPLYGVDHLVGHLLSVFLRRAEDRPSPRPKFPFVCLIASGGHTALYRVDAPHSSRIVELGATRDDAAGEAFDKVAKVLGLGYPGGPVIDRLAAQGDPTRIPFVAPMAHSSSVAFPRPMRHDGSLEFSFSGLKTSVAAYLGREGAPAGRRLADVCASFQSVVTSTLAEKLLRAALRENVGSVVLGGGVAANRELRARVTDLAAERGIAAHLPSPASCTDNAAMIAYAGATRARYEAGDGWDLVATSATVLPRNTRKGRGPR